MRCKYLACAAQSGQLTGVCLVYDLCNSGMHCNCLPSSNSLFHALFSMTMSPNLFTHILKRVRGKWLELRYIATNSCSCQVECFSQRGGSLDRWQMTASKDKGKVGATTALKVQSCHLTVHFVQLFYSEISAECMLFLALICAGSGASVYRTISGA